MCKPAAGKRRSKNTLVLMIYRVRKPVDIRSADARRYMNEMDIYPIYPKMNLSKRMQQAKVCPYLLRNAVIDRPN